MLFFPFSQISVLSLKEVWCTFVPAKSPASCITNHTLNVTTDQTTSMQADPRCPQAQLFWILDPHLDRKWCFGILQRIWLILFTTRVPMTGWITMPILIIWEAQSIFDLQPCYMSGDQNLTELSLTLKKIHFEKKNCWSIRRFHSAGNASRFQVQWLINATPGASSLYPHMWLMVIPWCVTLSGCRGWLLRCSNHLLYGDIGSWI